MLPYLAQSYFTHQRVDNRRPLVITYIRRPNYYAIFNAGQSQTSQQRFGLGLLWHPLVGTLIQTQSNSAVAAWGTMPTGGQTSVYEADISEATYQVSGWTWTPQWGAADLADGEVEISYPLGTFGYKTLTFNDAGLDVQVTHHGRFIEYIPLLIGPADDLVIEQGRVMLTRTGVTLEITTSKGVSIRTQPTGERCGRYNVIAVQLNASEALTYNIRF